MHTMSMLNKTLCALVCAGLFALPAAGMTAQTKEKNKPAPKAAPVPDNPVYNALTMADVGQIMLLAGLSYEVQDIKGEGVVANQRLVVHDQLDWSVFGYDCAPDTAACHELQLRAVFLLPATGPVRDNALLEVNRWNANNRFTHAYKKKTALILEMDIYIGGGLGLRNLLDEILIWRQSVRRFSSSLSADGKSEAHKKPDPADN